jgi:hypothetical protein
MTPSRLSLRPDGSFDLRGADQFSYLYFPLFAPGGMLSCVSPEFQGDAKTDLNHFLLPPVSVEDLRHSLWGRHVFFLVDGELYSNTGKTPIQKLSPDRVDVSGELLVHTIVRANPRFRLETTSFVPVGEDALELHRIVYRNLSKNPQRVLSTVMVPLYGRSADNLRDHRHVTSLLNRAVVTDCGVINRPTLSFDERGHLVNKTAYGAFASSSRHPAPSAFFPTLEGFVGEGCDLSYPAAPRGLGTSIHRPGDRIDGYESCAGIQFGEILLPPGETISITFALAIGDKNDESFAQLGRSAAHAEAFDRALEATRAWWKHETGRFALTLGDANQIGWLKWVSAQPLMRRVFGNSFLPYHDYGRGGRGWRDLWQDLLAQIIGDPNQVRKAILNNVGGIRVDGSNATIVGHKEGEFVADRNKIVRVWSDHGVWGLITVDWYAQRTGDASVFLAEQSYFADKFTHYTHQTAPDRKDSQDTVQRGRDGRPYAGTILEHLIVEHVVPFYNVGDHGNIRLEDADWNDGLDMAKEAGETVAFTALYAGNLRKLASWVRRLEAFENVKTFPVFRELAALLDDCELVDPKERRAARDRFFDAVAVFSGETVAFDGAALACALERMAATLERQINQNEWMHDGVSGWYNGYYDKHGARVDRTKPDVRMTLTAQVFPLMARLADKPRIAEVVASVNRHLYRPSVRGIRLNTPLGEDNHTLGRLMGFAFGHKENGAPFSHMSVMYAYALLTNGFVKEGTDVLDGIYDYCSNVEQSRMYPGIPEYLSEDGRGMYPYLTGSASWVVITLVEQVFGAQGVHGELRLEPKLRSRHFHEGEASVKFAFFGKTIVVRYLNPEGLDYGDYRIEALQIGEDTFDVKQDYRLVTASQMKQADTIVVRLERKPQ